MEQAIGNAPYVAPQTLLIVDDDAINRGILDNIFSAYYMDGLETLQHLKRLDLLDEVPVFLITVESSDALMESGDRVRRIHDITQHMLEHTDWGEGLTQESMEQMDTFFPVEEALAGMDAWKKEQLAAAGINVAGVLKRFAGNEAPLERMLQRFTGDADYAQLMEAAGGQYAEGADRKPIDDGAVSAVHPPGGVGTRTRLMPCCRRSHGPMSG